MKKILLLSILLASCLAPQKQYRWNVRHLTWINPADAQRICIDSLCKYGDGIDTAKYNYWLNQYHNVTRL